MTQERIHNLRLVTAIEAEEATPVERTGFDAPPPSARPSERLEAWPLDEDPFARGLAEAAVRRGVSFQLAAALVVERSLLQEDLAKQGLSRMLERLDEEAVRASVEIELSEPLSAYLRALSSRERQPTRAQPRLVALPMRLIERIGGAGPGQRLDAALLESAFLWERAAVLAGRTMSEWATLKTLELVR